MSEVLKAYLHGWEYRRPRWSEEIINKETMVKKIHVDELRFVVTKVEDMLWVLHRDIRALDAALINHIGKGGISRHPVATTSVAGFQSSEDKALFEEEIEPHFRKGDGRIGAVKDPKDDDDAINLSTFRVLSKAIDTKMRELTDKADEMARNMVSGLPRYNVYMGGNNRAASPSEFDKTVKGTLVSLGSILTGASYYAENVSSVPSVLYEMGIECTAACTVHQMLSYIDDNAFVYLNDALVFSSNMTGRSNTYALNFPAGKANYR